MKRKINLLDIFIAIILLLILGHLMSCSPKAGCQLGEWHMQRKVVNTKLTPFARHNLKYHRP